MIIRDRLIKLWTSSIVDIPIGTLPLRIHSLRVHCAGRVHMHIIIKLTVGPPKKASPLLALRTQSAHFTISLDQNISPQADITR